MGQAVCTPPGYQAGQPQNKADRAGGMQLRWLTFELWEGSKTGRGLRRLHFLAEKDLILAHGYA